LASWEGWENIAGIHHNICREGTDTQFKYHSKFLKVYLQAFITVCIHLLIMNACLHDQQDPYIAEQKASQMYLPNPAAAKTPRMFLFLLEAG